MNVLEHLDELSSKHGIIERLDEDHDSQLVREHFVLLLELRHLDVLEVVVVHFPRVLLGEADLVWALVIFGRFHSLEKL